MPEPSPTTFKLSEVSDSVASFVEAANGGGARLEGLDGRYLAVLPERRLQELLDVVHWIRRYILIESALRRAPGDRSQADFGDLPWLGAFDADDLATFAAELRTAMLAIGSEGASEALHRLVADWEVTAGTLDEPEGRDILLGGYDAQDFVEVDRPR